MTYEEREAIFAKEALSVADVQALFGVCKSEATIHIGTATESRPDYDLKIALVEQERDLYKKLYEQLLERLSAGGR